MTARDPLRRVRTARAKRDDAQRAFRDALIAARMDGATFRELGDAAGMSHVAVQKIVRGVDG